MRDQVNTDDGSKAPYAYSKKDDFRRSDISCACVVRVYVCVCVCACVRVRVCVSRIRVFVVRASVYVRRAYADVHTRACALARERNSMKLSLVYVRVTKRLVPMIRICNQNLRAL